MPDNHDNHVDIQKIMDEIRADIAAKGIVSDIPAFEDLVVPGVSGQAKSVDTKDIRRELAGLKKRHVLFRRKITSHYKILTPFVVAGKLLIRKLLFFLLMPMVNDINAYHKKLVHILDLMEQKLAAVSAAQDRLARLEDELHALQSRQILFERDCRRFAEQELRNERP